MAAAKPEPPILVRNDNIMYRFLQNQKDKFKITIDITSDDNIYAKYEICLFMYDMKSDEREECSSLKDDYHSAAKKGYNCAYVGFINKELDDEVHNKFFFKDNTTTWFLDYKIIDPDIKINEITKENYSAPFTMNKKAINEVKKISYAEGDIITTTIDKFGEEVHKRTFDGTLSGEHVVISNGLKPIFTLSELSFNHNYTKTHNILSRVLNKFLIIALLNEKNKFTYKNGPDENMIILNFDIQVNSIEYITATTETYLTCRENINKCIENILTCLKNDSVANYVQTNLLPEIERKQKIFNIMDKKISTLQNELVSIFKSILQIDSNKKLIEARDIVNRGYIPSNTTIFTEASQILKTKKQDYLTKNIELDQHFQGLLDLAKTISDPQLITKTIERQKLAETETQSVINKFDAEINEQASLNAKIIENQEQIQRKRNEEQARLTEEEVRRKQASEQMSPENKQKKMEESKRQLIEPVLLKPLKTSQENRKRKKEENHIRLQKQHEHQKKQQERIKQEEEAFLDARDSLKSIQEINTINKILDVFNNIIIDMKNQQKSISMDNKQKSIPMDNKQKLKMEILLKNIKTYLDNMKKHFIKDKSFDNLKEYLIGDSETNIQTYFIKNPKIIKHFVSHFEIIFKQHHDNVLVAVAERKRKAGNIPASRKKLKPSGGSKKKKLTRKMKK
jgi:hypothetical protein